jgi:hypothetical protein
VHYFYKLEAPEANNPMQQVPTAAASNFEQADF